MTRAVISATGLFSPPQVIDNDELVESFNTYVHRYNERNAEAIEKGELTALEPSASAFIEKASGIKRRHVMDKDGILDPERMRPSIPQRPNSEYGIQCEMGMKASREALERAGFAASDVDAVIVACSNLERPYPAVAVELQDALGIEGFAYDMNVACSSATFGIQAAADSIANGHARAILVVSPEICSAHLNFRDRDSHFIFGDACTAVLVQAAEDVPEGRGFDVLGSRLKTRFSNNIRNNFGFLNRADESGIGQPDKLFVQEGRKVFKEVSPLVAELIGEHLESLGLQTDQLRRLWLHQANLNMNELIAKRVLGHEPGENEAPVILDEYANTSSAGSIIAFDQYQDDLTAGDHGVICSFGAGYSIGNVVVRKR
ncbi:beta-ketodecanoyl-[acyl-carrier-protein] synthase [Halospina denitrificans]|uniref:Beta-ketodecanoyl-[acyl-carrier-protein] synthase n=1 Tax=Halospina denitrificans TaxID=332522 RepID=A0A4R7JU45_9GAMM|nr:beta-ketodecanoyl-[acyl-carrier-protein] synthase [Halospina denitrificans]